MMLPLCTSVTESRLAAMAYSMALRTSRLEPNSDIGLMPMAEASRILEVVRRSIELRNSMTLFASADPAGHSMPAYTSSVFSRKMTMSTFCGSRTGEGTPSK